MYGCTLPGLLLFLGASLCSGECPCSDPALCQPIRDSRDFEVYVFYVRGKNWKNYDWAHVTTVALFAPYDPELMCFAHSKGARFVLKGDFEVKDIVDSDYRTAWIAEKVKLAKAQYMDGINLDIEQPVFPNTAEYYALTALVKETTEAFHREIPGSQVTFDVAWSPNCIDIRCYNYSGIADLCDFLFVMSYDEQSQIWTECIAGANAPFNKTITGYEQFINLGIDPKKLVMGVPWYGYEYVCLNLTEDNQCTIEKKPFRGAECSDAVGTQVAYRAIMKQVNNSLSGRLWDDVQKAPFYHYKVYVFHVRDNEWKNYDWAHVTTVALFTPYDPELMCFAHSKGARIVLKGDVSVKDIVDSDYRTAWIAEKVKLAKAQYMDGINLDIEQPVLPDTAEYYALTALVKETTEAFHREIPGSQVTFDVAWAPNCVALRCYNYTAIADLCDFLFVMSYDEPPEKWTECIAGANAPFNQTIAGYEMFIYIGIDPKKLVMGVPWYGYDYVCLQLTEENWCKLKNTPFQGAERSNYEASQLGYCTIMKQVNDSLSGRLWDHVQKAPFYNYRDTKGNIHQVWYDDPQSISSKVAYIKKLGLRGVGMWHGDTLDYSADPIARQQTADMWKALLP